jgi:putative redox protein
VRHEDDVMIKTAIAHHTGPGLRFSISTGGGHQLAVDDAGGDTAPRPAELLLAAQAGCTAMDVAAILARKRQMPRSYYVSVSGEQRDEPHPHIFQRIDVTHEFEGPGLDEGAVRRAIELSATRYCTVAAMLSAGPTEIHHRYLIRRSDGRPDETDEVAVTGPNAKPDVGTEPGVTSLTTRPMLVALGGPNGTT